MDAGRVLRRLDHLVILLTFALLAAAGAALVILPAEPAPNTSGQVSRVDRSGARPKMLVIPSIGVNADIVRIEVTPDGVLDPPSDTQLVGWWQRSAKAGASRGQTVMTGHNVSHGTGVMDDLHKLAKDDSVLVRTSRTRVEYRVTGKSVLNAQQVARRAVKLFGQDRPRNRLVLVTCADYRNGVWNKNTIVFAQPVSVRRL